MPFVGAGQKVKLVAVTSCSRWLYETELGRPDQAPSCCFLKVATHPSQEIPRPVYSDSPPKRIQPFGRFSFSKRIALRFLASCSILSNDNT